MVSLSRNIIFVVLLCILSYNVFASDSILTNVNIIKKDSTSPSTSFPSYSHLTDSIINLQVKNPIFKPNSKTAMLWGLLPGGGQIYNKKYWKLPIVWGAFTTCVYAIRFNQQRYTEYHDAYRDMSSSDPSKNTAWLAFTPRGTNPSDYEKYKYLLNNFKRGDEFFHRWRDISIVSAIGVYALSIIDAYVDAELSTFDISPDLSLRVYPKLEQSVSNGIGYQMALGCTLSF